MIKVRDITRTEVDGEDCFVFHVSQPYGNPTERISIAYEVAIPEWLMERFRREFFGND